MVLAFPNYCLEAAALIQKTPTTGATVVKNEQIPERNTGVSVCSHPLMAYHCSQLMKSQCLTANLFLPLFQLLIFPLQWPIKQLQPPLVPDSSGCARCSAGVFLAQVLRLDLSSHGFKPSHFCCHPQLQRGGTDCRSLSHTGCGGCALESGV